jgi:tetratricopeptide (TPR) repeat protein
LAIVYAPIVPFNYYNSGVFYLQQNNENKALKAFETFIKLNNQNLKLALNRMIDYDIDYDCFKDIIPENAKARLQLGAFLLEKGYNRQALVEFTYAYELQPDSLIALRHLQTLQRLRYNQEALTLAQIYNRNHPHSLLLSQQLATLYIKNGATESAISLYGNLIDKWPKKTQLYVGFARIYANNMDYGSAISILKQGLKEANDRAHLNFVISSYYQRANRNEEALMASKEAVKLKPYSVPYRYHLGKIYRAYGLPQEAVEQWEECLQINPSHQPSRNAIDAIYKDLNL